MRVINIFIALIIIINLSIAQDQIKQNVYSLGGSLEYYSTTNNNGPWSSDQTVIELIPSLSYFILDQFEVSLNVEYVHETDKQTSPANLISNEMKYTALGLGLGIRYYIPFGKYSPFIGASGGTSWSFSGSQSYSTPSTNFLLTGGLDIFISESAAIEPTVSYAKYRYDEMNSRNVFQAGIGVKYFIL